ncbi:type VII secretion system-associated protein [Streptomyces tendae]|uniref:type VII secretion system-associated protein n=1 Tax=Streptomyces tendae TaxID=1932 RepID=UPI00378A3C9D
MSESVQSIGPAERDDPASGTESVEDATDGTDRAAASMAGATEDNDGATATAYGTTESTDSAARAVPRPPDDIREAARRSPDHWFGMVDPAWTGDGAPPLWAIVGQWRSGPDGEIVEWQDNEEYRQSPRALGWPEPADEVDAAVQLAATGYGPEEDVHRALAALREAAVFVTPDGSPLPATAPDGETPVVPLFTSPVYLHLAGRLAFDLVPVADLLDRVPDGHLLYLNPWAPVSMTVETEAVYEALAGAATTGTTAEEDQADGEGEDEADGETAPRPSTVSASADTERGPSRRESAVEDVSSETVRGLL